VDALRKCRCEVWFDQSDISEFAPITAEIRRGLAESKALLAWYSEEYPKSRPCQMELTAAFLAAQREGEPSHRVLVINSANGSDHVEPVELRDARYATAPLDSDGYATLAAKLAKHVTNPSGSLGGILPIVLPDQYGLKLTGAKQFVGRLPDLWRIHSALSASERPIIAESTTPLAIVNGLGGMGKSLLAEEYALRFGAAYPGGIFWLHAFGNDREPTIAYDPEAVRIQQFEAVALMLGLKINGLGPIEVEAKLRTSFSSQGKRFLWIIDDLPEGLSTEAVRSWLAPSQFGKTLVTTRGREHDSIGESLSLDVLKPEEAFNLLCSERVPADATEEVAARGVAADFGATPVSHRGHGSCAARARRARFLRRISREAREPDRGRTRICGRTRADVANGSRKASRRNVTSQRARYSRGWTGCSLLGVHAC
jgi:TIR domain